MLAYAAPSALPDLSRCPSDGDLEKLSESISTELSCQTDRLDLTRSDACTAPPGPSCGNAARERILALVFGGSPPVNPRDWPVEARRCQVAIARAASLFVEKRFVERARDERRAVWGKALRRIAPGCRDAVVTESRSGELLPRVGGACASLIGAVDSSIDGERLGRCLRASLERAIDDTAPETLRPNIVVVITDDQRWDTIQYMPAVESLARQGLTFRNAFTTTPVCAPSRASLFSGKYPHSHGLWRGRPTQFDPSTSFAPLLQGAGYTTGFFGKYLNGAQVLGETVPPGWDEWQITLGGAGGDFHGFQLNENGVFRTLDESQYSTDYLAGEAVEFIGEHADEPFLAFYAPFAPHGPADPAKRHQGKLADLPPWRPPSWHEDDVSKKPAWVKYNKSATTDQITAKRDELRIRELETLLSVDEGVARIVDLLERAGLTDNTVVIYTSDHGIHWGEHWSGSKFTAYEESVRVPLVLRYPLRAPAGEVRDELVLNLDLAPTLAQLAGVRLHGDIDGQSLVPLFASADVPWREDFLIENPGEFISAASEAVRTKRWKYIETWRATGSRKELYDLAADPYELVNLAYDPAFAELRASLAARLEELRERETSKVYRPPSKAEARKAAEASGESPRRKRKAARAKKDDRP